MKPIKVMFLGDPQYDQHDPRAIDVALQIVLHYRPHTAVILGDFICCDAVASYKKASWREADLRLESEVISANKGLDYWDRVFKKAGVKRKVFLEGNHESRLTRWLVNNAFNLGDMLKIENLLKLKERKYEYISLAKQPLQMGKADIMHGYYVNVYHASKMVKETGRNCIYGHTHDYQAYISSHLPKDLPKIAMSCGCLCKFDQHYIGQRPTKWVHGVGIMEYLPDGFFTAVFLPIIGYRCIFQGKVFKG